MTWPLANQGKLKGLIAIIHLQVHKRFLRRKQEQPTKIRTVMTVNAINTKDAQQFNNQQNELSKLSGVVKELTAKIELLENKNKELTKQVETLSNKIQQPDPEKMQNEIKTIAETVLNQSIDNKVKDFQLKVTQKTGESSDVDFEASRRRF